MKEQCHIEITDKEALVENVCDLPGTFTGIKVVRLDIKHGDEKRYRLRTPSGNESRISEAETAHRQQQKLHIGSGLYNIRNGWIAIITEDEDGLKVNIGFAGVIDRFYVTAPANEWYIAVLSGPAAWSYGTSDDNTGQVEKDGALYKKAAALTEEDIFKLYSDQQGLPYDQVLQWSKDCMKVK